MPGSQNLALSEAITYDAIATTPETPSPATWPLKSQFYSRVLPAGHTQLTAMLAQKPDVVSVEFGANEILESRTGLLAPGVTIVPVSAWKPAYDILIAGVRSANAKVVLAGLMTDATNFPSLRTGAEIDAIRAEFAEFGIPVSANCGGSASQNYVYVPAKVVGAYAGALAARAAGRPASELSCADIPGVKDYVLTPAEIAAVDAQLAEMDAYIRATASDNGFAYFSLDPLYGRPDLKAPFSVRTVLMSPEPYGPYISLDVAHPSGAGHTILAREAAKALNGTYQLAIGRGQRPWRKAARYNQTVAASPE